MTRLHAIAAMFADGTPLSPHELAEGRDAGIFGTHGANNGWALTEYGVSLLAGCKFPRPPGDSASCPDDDAGQRTYDVARNSDPDDDSYLAPSRLARHEERMVKVRAEADPHGKDQHETGAKLDAGKVRLGLVLGAFSNALVEVGKVGTYGAQKYTDNGWLDVPEGKARYTDALLRHIFAEASGEECDSDTGLSHLAHACWNMLAVLELHMRSKE